MKPITWVAALWATWAIASVVQPARAQVGYYGNRVTFSPHLGVPSTAPTTLGQYARYVGPGQQLTRALGLQRMQIGQPRAQASQGQVTQLQIGPVSVTGTGSTYMNLSHYYTGFGGGGARQSRGSQGSQWSGSSPGVSMSF